MAQESQQQKTGVWLIGAFGGVASTAVLGWCCLRDKTLEPWGLVSELAEFQNLDWLPWSQLVFGGHDIRHSSFLAAAESMSRDSRAIDYRWVDRYRSELEQNSTQVRPGSVWNCGDTIRSIASDDFICHHNTPREAKAQISRDLLEFAERHELSRVIVVNVASTEPPPAPELQNYSWPELEAHLDDPRCALPASSVYAWAALDLGFPYINFTPSLGSNLPALRELALARSTCHAGRDGKTGETFLKSVLGPAFAARNLRILSWVGHNIFGNMDGQVLNDPINKATKVRSKDSLLGQILGYQPQTHTSIEYIASLGDWKTAWDHIHFQGFLGTPMTMQFTWQGCDSILAAPLVLDLVRFAELAHRSQCFGELTALSSFFKSPQGTPEQNFFRQWQQLLAWTAQLQHKTTA